MVNQRVFVSWLPVAIGISIALGTVYAAVQQNYRQSANDPQVQLSEDYAALLANGLSVDQLSNGLPPVDISKSLSLFVMVFDSTGNTLFSSGKINGNTPTLPSGVLDSTKTLGVNMITWQLPGGERFATVIRPWQGVEGNSGYVLVARSLREIEDREFDLELIVGVAWLISMIATLVAEWFKLLYYKKYIIAEPM